jgi:hypothetical protein
MVKAPAFFSRAWQACHWRTAMAPESAGRDTGSDLNRSSASARLACYTTPNTRHAEFPTWHAPQRIKQPW